ncbi:PAP2 family protein, partial [Streptomyces sp. NPDC002130]
YFLDAVAGAAVMGAGLLLAPLVMRTADRVKASSVASSTRPGRRSSSSTPNGTVTSTRKRGRHRLR